MDFLRSCYRGKIKYIRGDQSIKADAYWYFAADTAIPFPTEHAFASDVWDNVHPTPTALGWDAESPRTYYNGRRLNSSDGTSFAGPLEDFQIGAPQQGFLARGTNQTPIQCLGAPFGLSTGGMMTPVVIARGGLRTGGSTYPVVVPGVSCAFCTGVTPYTISVTLGGFSGSYADYNGTFQLIQTGVPCVWFLALAGTHSLTLSRTAGGTWTLGLTGSAVACTYQGTTADCLGPDTIALLGSTIGGDATCTVVAP